MTIIYNKDPSTNMAGEFKTLLMGKESQAGPVYVEGRGGEEKICLMTTRNAGYQIRDFHSDLFCFELS